MTRIYWLLCVCGVLGGQQVERYLQVAQDQASAFHYESAMHQLDPCAPVKGSRPKPGDPQWCLCGSNGLRIRWEEGDDSAVQAILDAPSKDTNPEQLNALLSLPSSCREGNRKSLCHWKGNITDGSCCSKAGGCYKGPMRKPDRKECVSEACLKHMPIRMYACTHMQAVLCAEPIATIVCLVEQIRDTRNRFGPRGL